MSSNSWLRTLETAPIVRALRRRDAPSAFADEPLLLSVATATSALQVTELVLADLDLVAVLELVRLDPAAVHVGPVQGAEVVYVQAVLAAHHEGVVARHGDVVQEHLGVGAAADAHPVGVDREALPRSTPARADDERGSGFLDLLVDVHRVV